MAPASTSMPGHRPTASSHWKRRLLVVLALPLLAIGGGYLWFSISGQRELDAAIAETDRLDPDWRLDDLLARRPPIPDEENAALTIAQTVRLLGGKLAWKDEHTRAFEKLAVPCQLNEQQLRLLNQLLEGKGPALQMARTLKGQPRGRHAVKYTEDFISTNSDFLLDTRHVGNFMQWDALRRCQIEDLVGALDNCLALLNTGRAIEDEPFLLAYLMRNAVLADFIRLSERALAQGELPPGRLTALQNEVEKEAQVPALWHGMRGERGGMFRTIQAIREGKLNEMRDARSYMPGHWARQQAHYLLFMNRMVRAAQAPLDQQKDQFLALDLEIQALNNASPILGEVAPALLKIYQSHHRTITHLRCAQAALAAERFRFLKKAWPIKLEDLVAAGLLDQFPIDLFSGQPIKLLARPDGITIYSVGQDGKDDGGDLNPIFGETGADLGFRLWNVPARRQPALPPVPLEEEP